MYLALVHVPGALVEVRVGSELSDGTQHRLLVQFQVSRELDSEYTPSHVSHAGKHTCIHTSSTMYNRGFDVTYFPCS